uniref:COMM domain-containing protein n=1 Tax=Elaeophora elaphi TaxID=1147741 RepID=A0A0R3RV58_9BILA
MDLSAVTVDVGQYSDQSILQSFINKIKHHNLLELKLQIGTSSTNEADKIVWTLDVSFIT